MDIYFKGKLVGYTTEDTYIVHKKPEHFMRIYQGFGISVEVLNQLISQGIKYIKMIYAGAKSQITYLFPIEAYIKSTLDWTDGENDVQKFVKARGYEIKEG